MVRGGVVARVLAMGLLLRSLTAPAAPATGPATRAASPPRPPTLAVLYFDYSGHDLSLEALRKGLAQMLISDLAAVDTLRIVERERLQAVLEEQKLARSGKLDAGTAGRIGKLLGARYLVLGSYFDVLGAFRVDARLVDVETGEVVKSVGANGKADDFLGLEQTLAEGLRQAAGTLTPAPGAGGRASAGAGARTLAVAGDADRRGALKSPRQLKTETALVYGRALVALDDGDRKTAQALFRKVLSAQPDFALAQRDLDKLMQ
jgi:TolB-like protein